VARHPKILQTVVVKMATRGSFQLPKYLLISGGTPVPDALSQGRPLDDSDEKTSTSTDEKMLKVNCILQTARV